MILLQKNSVRNYYRRHDQQSSAVITGLLQYPLVSLWCLDQLFMFIGETVVVLLCCTTVTLSLHMNPGVIAGFGTLIDTFDLLQKTFSCGVCVISSIHDPFSSEFLTSVLHFIAWPPERAV